CSSDLWCSKGSIILSRVLSCPPCKLEVEVKTPAGLLTSSPVSQRLLVPSKKYFIAAAMLPKRVGLPRARPAQFLRSSRVAYIAPSAGISGATASHSVETEIGRASCRERGEAAEAGGAW